MMARDFGQLRVRQDGRDQLNYWLAAVAVEIIAFVRNSSGGVASSSSR